MIICRACKLPHPPTERCEVARRRIAAENAVTEPVNTKMVVDSPEVVVDEAALVVDHDNGGSRHGKYADVEKRRQYQKEWAAAKRRKKT